MSTSIPSKESLKDKAKVIKKFMKEKCNSDISHSHCLELISQIFGIKDWNTVSGLVKSEVKNKKLPIVIKNIGDLHKASEHLNASTSIEVDDSWLTQGFFEALNELGHTDGTILNKYSLVLVETPEGKAKFRLKLEDQRIGEINLYQDHFGNFLY